MHKNLQSSCAISFLEIERQSCIRARKLEKMMKNKVDRRGFGGDFLRGWWLTWCTGGGDRGSGVGRLAHLSMTGQVAAVSILHP